MDNFIAIVDFGSQYTHLIETTLLNLGVKSKTFPCTVSFKELHLQNPKGIIFSGRPDSVYNKNSAIVETDFLKGDIPILGICYGMQVIAYLMGGVVRKSAEKEYGSTLLVVDKEEELFRNTPAEQKVWMSHGDLITELPKDFIPLAHTEKTAYAAMRHKTKKIYGVQFHPEVFHTEYGSKILGNFVFNIAGYESDFKMKDSKMKDFVSRKVPEIRNIVGHSKVLGALSGGVDSIVASVLTQRAIGNNLILVFVDTGLLRIGDRKKIEELREKEKLNVSIIDASSEFLTALKGITEPERKRKIIGQKFIKIFEEFCKKHKEIKFLLQGTIYPDVVESGKVSTSSPGVIKSHHNVGGLPEEMNLRLLEPLRGLFKNDVRALGRVLGIDNSLLMQHPFPGPGLSIRIIGEVTKEKLDILRRVDKIYIDVLKDCGVYEKVWQAFSVLLPIRSVGVVGDQRAYKFVVALRAVLSRDGMTADWARIPYEVLEKASLEITSKVPEVGRVVYDITSKPPGTIEWE